MTLASLPAGPKGQPLVGNLPEMSRSILRFFERCARDYGDVVQAQVMGLRFYALMHPAPIEEVLVTKARSFIKSEDYRSDLDFLGQGLLTSEGEHWLRQRRLMQPAFHRQRIAAYGDTMVAYTERLLGEWQGGEVRDIHHDMMRLTLEIVAKTLMGADLSGDAAYVGKALELFMAQAATEGNFLRALIPDSLPTPGNLRRKRMRERLDAMIFRIIAERRAGEGRGPEAPGAEDRGDLLSMLLAAQDEDGSRMSDRQLRDELLTIVLAGHETTANALSWAHYLLARHPEVEARLAAELDEVLAGRAPTVADLPSLPYTDLVIKESMRLYPPVWGIGREAAEDCEIAGYFVPKGTQMFLLQWIVQRDPRFYDEPLAFRPERWQDGLEKRLPHFAYFPFGGGQRMCIGNNFALMEAKLLLATMVRRYRLRPLPGHPVVPQPSITLRPKHGLMMRLEER